MNTNYMLDALGYEHNMRDGAYVWKSESPSPEILALCELKDILAEDLDRPSVAVDVEKEKATIDVLKKLQCDEIRRLRKLAYRDESDGLMCEAEYDQSEEKMNGWRGKVAEIKAQYPWPGDYR